MHVRRDLGGSAVRIDGRDAETGAPQHRLGNSCFFVSPGQLPRCSSEPAERSAEIQPMILPLGSVATITGSIRAAESGADVSARVRSRIEDHEGGCAAGLGSMAGRFKPNHASEIRSFERTLSFVGQIGGRELSFA